MIPWQIEYWNAGTGKSPVERWLEKLTKEQLKSVAEEISVLEILGNELKLPRSKPLGKGLFELRERSYGYRIYYGFCGKRLIILLAAGDKQSQERDIEIARKRLEGFKKEKK